jgi:hypothetical protein
MDLLLLLEERLLVRPRGRTHVLVVHGSQAPEGRRYPTTALGIPETHACERCRGEPEWRPPALPPKSAAATAWMDIDARGHDEMLRAGDIHRLGRPPR